MNYSDFNHVVIELSYQPDKFMGLESWQSDVRFLVELAQRLGVDDGRRRASVLYQLESADDDFEGDE